jgi:hypothetical protein
MAIKPVKKAASSFGKSVRRSSSRITALFGARRHSWQSVGAYLLLGCTAFGLVLAWERPGKAVQLRPKLTQTAATMEARATVPLSPAADVQQSQLTEAATTPADPWMQLVGTALDAADANLRLEAAHELGERADVVSLQVLEQLLYDSQRKVRVAAMDALALRPSLEIQDILVRAIPHPDPRIRSLAQEALEELREGPVIRVSSLY